MTPTARLTILAASIVLGVGLAGAESRRPIAELSAEVVRDKIRGGLLGQMLGNLNGLDHEFKYIDEPGDVQEYGGGMRDGNGYELMTGSTIAALLYAQHGTGCPRTRPSPASPTASSSSPRR